MQLTDLQALKAEVDANIQAVFNSTQFIGEPFVWELEERLANFVDQKH